MALQDRAQTVAGGWRWPVHGWVGLALVAAAWPLNWSLPGPRTHLLFFALWLGYCLTVDAIVLARSGTSLVARSWKKYSMLFVISAPAWWLFEVINWRTVNWIYEGRELFTVPAYVILQTVSFSTVMPAVFGTAELVSTFGWVRRMQSTIRVPGSPAVVTGLFLAGCTMLSLLLWQPLYFYPFVWGSVYAILAPVNHLLGRRTLLRYTARRDWRPVVSLCLGCLICGFFWEMWNYWSYPKWVYRVPFLQFWHVFEMPVVGFIGYLPFSLELFALYHLNAGAAAQEYVLPGFAGDSRVGGTEKERRSSLGRLDTSPRACSMARS